VEEKNTKLNKGGRPSKGKDARYKTVGVSFSECEYDEIMSIQKLTKQSKSDIVYNRYRMNEFNFVKISTFPIEHLRLFKIANNNLNQIAKAVNTNKQTSLDKYQIKELREIADLLLKLEP
jgi:hypothetical protein